MSVTSLAVKHAAGALTRMNGIGTIVKNGTLIVFSVRKPVVEFVTLYENFTLIALRFASKPTALMNCTVEMAAAACALMIAVSGPAQSQQQAISSGPC